MKRRRAVHLFHPHLLAINIPTPDPAELCTPCPDADALHRWLKAHLDLDIPREPVCAGHDAPFEYVHSAYFEPGRDLVVWAPRGGGKTRLAAAVTLLDLLHKPGVAVRILGGSLDQSLRMWEHLVPDLERLAGELILPRKSNRKLIHLSNRSSVAVLPQSQRAVRGLRIQKLRCDEVELFRPDVWESAQLVTRSRPDASGVVEAISTLHAPWGLMSRIIERARDSGTRVIRWCLIDVLERCPPQRECETCPLYAECQGIAKTRCNGFVLIDDAIAMKKRVSIETWETEMLCRRPALRGAVFPRFDPDVHVRDAVAGRELFLGIDFGFHAPFVCLWIMRDANDVVHVIDEYVQPARTIHEHIEQIRARPWGTPTAVACDPAGKARNDQTARSNVDALRAAGFLVRTRSSRVVDGVEMIRAALCPASGDARLFIHRRCVRLIRAMQCYRYPESGGETPHKDNEHDHLIDALRYYFVNRTRRVVVARQY